MKGFGEGQSTTIVPAIVSAARQVNFSGFNVMAGIMRRFGSILNSEILSKRH
jgi:predicted amidophosphoribosyltransferase